ncbi:MAG: hypothetical protein OEM46_07880 [Ignavibacteria bacterium]|nr:hypothetical protein [Ignavibacteria bacterium]
MRTLLNSSKLDSTIGIIKNAHAAEASAGIKQQIFNSYVIEVWCGSDDLWNAVWRLEIKYPHKLSLIGVRLLYIILIANQLLNVIVTKLTN